MFTKNDSTKKDFSFRFTTQSIQFDHKESDAFVEQAINIYNQDNFNFKKIMVMAPTLAMFAQAATELAREGFTVLESERAHASSLGNFAIRFVKNHQLQNEDREWIKKTVQDDYLSKVESNIAAYKAKLKADLLAEEKAKEALKQAEAEAKKQAKLQQEADKKFEQLLQEQGIA